MTIEMEKSLEDLKQLLKDFLKISSKTELIEENIETIYQNHFHTWKKDFLKIKFHKNLNLVNKNLKINKVLLFVYRKYL